MGPQGSCQGDTLELQQGLKLKQITLFMCTAMHIVLTLFSLTQQNQCLSLKSSFLCYRNCMCTCQAPMCTRNGSLCKRKCIKVPQEIYKGSVTPGGHVGTRLAKTLRTDCLLYCVCYMILMWRTEENALWRHRVYLPNWILPLSEHLSSFKKSLERQNSLQTCFGQRLLI